MSTAVQRRRGTNTEHDSFTGLEGEISVNTTNESVHVHDGSTAGGFEMARADGSNWAITNNISTTGNISFGDNDKAIFGAGSDLQISHDGSNSIIEDTSTGNLQLITNGNAIALKTSDGDAMLSAIKDGDVKLYYNNNLKLATTSTGIDVTGTATMDGLTVEQNTGSTITLKSTDTAINAGEVIGDIEFYSADASGVGAANRANITVQAEDGAGRGSMYFKTSTGGESPLNRALIQGNGDISFYEDTGTTAKLFWDASAERLGIGNAAPATALDVTGTITSDGLTVSSTDSTSITQTHTDGNVVTFTQSGTGGNIDWRNANGGALIRTGDASRLLVASNGDISFYEDTGTTAKLFWDASAESLGIGTTSPARNLVVKGSIPHISILANTNTQDCFLDFGDEDDDNKGRIVYSNNGDYFSFYSNAAERMRIDASGNVGIGTSSPDAPLKVVATAASSIPALGAASSHSAIGAGGFGTMFGTLTSGRGYIQQQRFDGTATGYDLLLQPNGGSVGIGTSSPSAKFHVLNAESTTNTVQIGSSTLTHNTGIYLRTTGVAGISWGQTADLAFYGGGAGASERMRIDASGNLLINTTSSPTTTKAIISADYSVSGTENTGLTIAGRQGGNWYNNGIHALGSSGLVFSTGTTGTNGADASNERVRIDSSGNLLVGTTTAGYAFQSGVAVNPAGASYVAVAHPNGAGSGNSYALFTYNAGIIGSITQNGTTGVSYNTSSDQRLKENIADAPSASDDIDAIQVRSFDWKADGSHQKYGMVAQELQSVAPEAVSGDSDSEEMMGVDYSKLVPMLIKEIQSLRNRVAQLEE